MPDPASPGDFLEGAGAPRLCEDCHLACVAAAGTRTGAQPQQQAQRVAAASTLPAAVTPDESPNRKLLREAAYKKQEKQGQAMMRRANWMAGGPVAVGSVVQVAMDEADLTKVDGKNLTGGHVNNTRMLRDGHNGRCSGLCEGPSPKANSTWVWVKKARKGGGK